MSYPSPPLTSHHLIVQLLHQQHSDTRHNKRKVRRTRRQKSIGKACSLTAALAVIRDIIRACGNLENGSVDRALVVEVDEEEVWWAAPVSCVTSVFCISSSLQGYKFEGWKFVKTYKCTG